MDFKTANHAGDLLRYREAMLNAVPRQVIAGRHHRTGVDIMRQPTHAEIVAALAKVPFPGWKADESGR